MPLKKTSRAKQENQLNSGSACGTTAEIELPSEAKIAAKKSRGRPARSRNNESLATRHLFPVDSEICAYFDYYKVAWLGYVIKLGVDERIVKLYDFSKPRKISVENLYSSAESLARAKHLPVDKVLVGLNEAGVKQREKYLSRMRNIASQEQEKDSERRNYGKSILPTLPDVRLEPIAAKPRLKTRNSVITSPDSDESENELMYNNEELSVNSTQEEEIFEVAEGNLDDAKLSTEEIEAQRLQQKRSKLFAMNGVKNLVCHMIDSVATDICAGSSGSNENVNPVCCRFLLDGLIDKLKREKLRDEGATLYDDAGWLSTFWATKGLVEKANTEFGGIVGNEASEKSKTPAVPWTCGICVRTPTNKVDCPNRRAWGKHVKDHLLAHVRFQCPHPGCPQSRSERYLLIRHVQSHGYTEAQARSEVSAGASHESRAADVVPITAEEAENIQKEVEKQQKRFRLDARRRRLEREEELLEAQSSDDNITVSRGGKKDSQRQRPSTEESRSLTARSGGEQEGLKRCARVGERGARGAGRQQRPRPKGQLQRPLTRPPLVSAEQDVISSGTETSDNTNLE